MAVENGFFSCFMSVEFLESSSEAARVSCTLVMQSACFTMTEIGEAGMPVGTVRRRQFSLVPLL